MSPLLSVSELQSLRDVAKTGFVSNIYISDHSVIVADDGSKDVWTERPTPVLGWLYDTTTPAEITIIDGAQGQLAKFRLFLEVGTDIATGDRVRVGAESFTVVDTDAESTWLPMLTVTLRRIE